MFTPSALRSQARSILDAKTACLLAVCLLVVYTQRCPAPHHLAPSPAVSQPDTKQVQLFATNSSVYYRGSYWNDFEAVRRHMNTKATGDPDVTWEEHLLRWNGNRPFRKALILSCGNGWVERALAVKGVIKDAVGIDVSDELLSKARAEASKSGYAFRYYVMDSNKATKFPEDEDFDLVVNYAALHHIAYLDLHIRKIASVLRHNNGTLVNYDYVGPHRNQFSKEAWSAAAALNQKLPQELRQHLAYPHLPTMLASDPSEAIHSELIVQTLRRYFTPVWEQHIGGALAYLLLTHNSALKGGIQETALDAMLQMILAEDAKFTREHPETTLFLYSIEVPTGNMPDAKMLQQWTAEEVRRESTAAANGGKYYDQTAVSKAVYGDF